MEISQIVQLVVLVGLVYGGIRAVSYIFAYFFNQKKDEQDEEKVKKLLETQDKQIAAQEKRINLLEKDVAGLELKLGKISRELEIEREENERLRKANLKLQGIHETES